MSEAVQLALINNLPLILTALGTLLSTLAGLWSVHRAGKAKTEAHAAFAEAKSTKEEVNGGLAKMLAALEAGHRAETKAAHAEGIVETLAQVAAPAQVAHIIVPGTASDRRKPETEL
jgi:hypothetical protein